MWSSSSNSLKAVKGFTHCVVHVKRYANVCYYEVNAAVSLPSATNLIFNSKCTCRHPGELWEFSDAPQIQEEQGDGAGGISQGSPQNGGRQSQTLLMRLNRRPKLQELITLKPTPDSLINHVMSVVFISIPVRVNASENRAPQTIRTSSLCPPLMTGG